MKKRYEQEAKSGVPASISLTVSESTVEPDERQFISSRLELLSHIYALLVQRRGLCVLLYFIQLFSRRHLILDPLRIHVRKCRSFSDFWTFLLPVLDLSIHLSGNLRRLRARRPRDHFLRSIQHTMSANFLSVGPTRFPRCVSDFVLVSVCHLRGMAKSLYDCTSDRAVRNIDLIDFQR